MAKIELKVGSVGISLGDMPKGKSGKAFFKEHNEQVSVKAYADVRQGYDVIVVTRHNEVVEYVRPSSESFLHHDCITYLAPPPDFVRGAFYEVGISQLLINKKEGKFISESTLVFSTVDVEFKWNEWDTVGVPVPAGLPITFFKRIRKFWIRYAGLGTTAGTVRVWMEGNHVIPGWPTRDV